MRPCLTQSLFAGGFVLVAGLAQAADVTRGDDGRCDVRLRGIIAAEDPVALTRALSQDGARGGPQVLCLDSPGGSLKAAIDMAQIVHDRGIATHVEDGASCESACSITYFMGTALAGDTRTIARKVAPRGRIGIHAPSLVLPADNTYSGTQVSQAFALAMEAAGSITTLGRNTDDRTGDAWIPVDVVNHMLTTPAEDMFHVTTFGQAQDWNIAIDGLDWPQTLSNAAVWNICNYGVRERMGWSHVAAIEGFDSFRQGQGTEPVTLVQRHLVGQGDPGVSEVYAARSSYLASGLRMACTVEVGYPVADRLATQVRVCVTAVPEAVTAAPILCDSPTDRMVVDTVLAGYDPAGRIEAVDSALDRMAQSGLPLRRDAD